MATELESTHLTASAASQLIQGQFDDSYTIIHPVHGEAYHASLGARSEAWYLYIEGSQFVSRLQQGSKLAVLDVGLGLGYNALATVRAFMQTPVVAGVELISLEIDDEILQQFLSGKASWQKNWSQEELHFISQIKKTSDGKYRAELAHSCGAKLYWQIFLSDAQSSRLAWDSWPKFDFIWQDAFSPEKNPPLWQAEWFSKLHSVASNGAVMMSYSVARNVKDALAAGGWNYEKIPGKGNKRHWLRAIKVRETASKMDVEGKKA